MFGSLLRKARLDASLTLESLGGKIGTTKGYISGIENEKIRPPRDPKIRKVAKVLGVDEKVLLKAAWLDRMPSDVKVLFQPRT